MADPILEGERLEIRYIPLSQAVLWDENPKMHDIGQLCASIRRYGFQDPPKYDATLGAFVYGNGRTHALMMMYRAHETFPRGILTDQEGQWHLPVKFGLDLESQAVARAFAIDHNNLTMAGGTYSALDMALMWDQSVYTTMLNQLGRDGMLPLTVDDDDLDLLKVYRQEPASSSDGGGQPEKALAANPEELLEKWGVELGQIWEIPSRHNAGCHYLMCGDTTNIADIEQLMDGELAQGIVTSPPYAAQRADKYGGPRPEVYLTWWEPVQANLRHVLRDDGSFFLNIKPHSDEGERQLYVMDLVIAMKRQWLWSFVDELCWRKPSMPGKMRYTFRNGFEPIYHFAVIPKGFKFRPDNVRHVSDEVPITRGPGHGERDWSKEQGLGIDPLPQGSNTGLALPDNVISAPHYEPARGHPAVFPVEIPEFFIRAYSDVGDRWLDPFVGSGSTIVAAERQERLAFGLDLKPAYIAISLERLSDCGLDPQLKEQYHDSIRRPVQGVHE